MNKFLIKYKKKLLLYSLFVLVLISFLDKELAAGLLLLYFLCLATFFILWKKGIKDKKLYLVLLIALLVHLSVVLFIYYSGFRPFAGGGDFESYNNIATEIANRVNQGRFSLEGLRLRHYFALVIGIIYILFSPGMLVGQLFTVWLAVLSVIFVYLIILEIGSSRKWAFLTCLIICFYPSYIYFGSLLLKDILVVPFVLISLFLSIKLFKRFSPWIFFLFFIFLTITTHFRFYTGYAVLFGFIFCWFLISSFPLKKRIIYGLAIVVLLGFSPQLLGYEYYGKRTLKEYINKRTITLYREVVYAPSLAESSKQSIFTLSERFLKEKLFNERWSKSSSGSSFIIDTGFEKPSNFIIGYLKSFTYSLLGPFPWHIRYWRQSFSLLETFPWYFLIYLFISGMIKSVKTQGLKTLKKYKLVLPLLVFAILSIGAFSLFITNFGIIARIRMPSFIALLCLFPLSRK